MDGFDGGVEVHLEGTLAAVGVWVGDQVGGDQLGGGQGSFLFLVIEDHGVFPSEVEEK
jgi:hypothetical protein